MFIGPHKVIISALKNHWVSFFGGVGETLIHKKKGLIIIFTVFTALSFLMKKWLNFLMEMVLSFRMLLLLQKDCANFNGQI